MMSTPDISTSRRLDFFFFFFFSLTKCSASVEQAWNVSDDRVQYLAHGGDDLNRDLLPADRPVHQSVHPLPSFGRFTRLNPFLLRCRAGHMFPSPSFSKGVPRSKR